MRKLPPSLAFLRWLSLLVFLATLALAVRSAFVQDDVFYFGKGDRWWCECSLMFRCPVFSLTICQPDHPPESRVGTGQFFAHESNTDRFVRPSWGWGPYDKPPIQFLGPSDSITFPQIAKIWSWFEYRDLGRPVARTNMIRFPYAPPIALTFSAAILLQWAVSKYRHRRRATTGLCPQCSYDLRAHLPGQRCPECGQVIPPTNH